MVGKPIQPSLLLFQRKRALFQQVRRKDSARTCAVCMNPARQAQQMAPHQFRSRQEKNLRRPIAVAKNKGAGDRRSPGRPAARKNYREILYTC